MLGADSQIDPPYAPLHKRCGPWVPFGERPGRLVGRSDNPDPGCRPRGLDQARQDAHRWTADELAHEPAGRVFVNVQGRAALNDAALLQDRDPGTQRQRFALVVSHVDHRRPEPAVQVDQLRAERGPERSVEARERLVEEEDPGPADERTPQRHPLPLAPGERPGPAPEQFPQTEHPRGLRHRTLDLRSRRPRARRPKARFSKTDRKGYTTGVWKTIATSRSRGASASTRRPSIQRLPAVSGSNPAINRKSVLLPEPDGPTITNSAPSSTVKSSGRTASIPPG